MGVSEQHVALLLSAEDQGRPSRAEGRGEKQDWAGEGEQARPALQHHAARRQRPRPRDRGKILLFFSSCSSPVCLPASHEHRPQLAATSTALNPLQFLLLTTSPWNPSQRKASVTILMIFPQPSYSNSVTLPTHIRSFFSLFSPVSSKSLADQMTILPGIQCVSPQSGIQCVFSLICSRKHQLQFSPPMTLPRASRPHTIEQQLTMSRN